MSSETLESGSNELFQWDSRLDPANYVFVDYYIESLVDAREAALAIAREQSANVVSQKAYGVNIDVSAATARVVRIRKRRVSRNIPILPTYTFSRHSRTSPSRKPAPNISANISIGYPISNFGSSLTNLWNAIGGEIHRLGFITTARIEEVEIPQEYLTAFSGPVCGAKEIRDILRVYNRPLFCRSTRPAVGLLSDEMLTINETVLTYGFDVVKDDELTCDTRLSEFSDRVERMVEMIHRVEARTGERKLYIANVIADGSKCVDYASTALEKGAKGVLVAPALQGLAVCSEIARLGTAVILAHNSWEDVLTRHPKLGVAPSVLAKLHRVSGANMLMMPGVFAETRANNHEEKALIASCQARLGNIRTSLPVIAGGKVASRMRSYARHANGSDFMMIVATAVDQHPKGIEAGASAFREAWERLIRAR